MATYKKTTEQKNILNTVKAIITKNEDYYKPAYILIHAGAGCGKTSTLRDVSILLEEIEPSAKILYFVFNNKNAREAEKKFPSNTFTSTIHSYALRKIKEFYNNKLKLAQYNYRPKDIMKTLNVNYNQAQAIINNFNRFCFSDRTIKQYLSNSNTIKEKVIEMYSLMKRGLLDMSHSFYLKEFQLLLISGQISFNSFPDFIFLDEAQDSNNVTLSIFNNIPSRGKIIVGDNLQRIYGFIDSINALLEIKAYTNVNYFKLYILPLLTSFRFTPEIAEKANFISTLLKLDATLVGKGKGVEVPKSKAIISRTNAFLIEETIGLLLKGKTNFKAIRDVDNIVLLPLIIIKTFYPSMAIKVDELIKRNRLNTYRAEKIINEVAKDYGRIKPIDIIKKELLEMDDIENYTAFNIVDKFNVNDLILAIEYLLTNKTLPDDEVEYWMTTAHTSKGLEFDAVKICADFKLTDILFKYYKDSIGSKSYKLNPKEENYFKNNIREIYEDFVIKYQNNKLPNKQLGEEFHLYYVAVTRCKEDLYLIDESDMKNIETIIDFLRVSVLKNISLNGNLKKEVIKTSEQNQNNSLTFKNI